MKKALFYTVMLTPLAVLVGAVVYLAAFTNLPPLVYLHAIRNIYFDCMQFVPEPEVYKMRPGPCKFSNIEFDTVLTHDADGFRNSGKMAHYAVATIGDSHSQGWGVADDQTYSALLTSKFGYPTRNLAIASYATARELEVLARYGPDAPYIVIQYCDNDHGENLASLRLDKAAFTARVDAEWHQRIRNYQDGKAMGLMKPLTEFANKLTNGNYLTITSWRASAKARAIEQEADAFGQILVRYRQVLEKKRVIVLESADSGRNSPRFATAFATALKKLNWLEFRLVDSSKVLDFSDYYYLDGHLTVSGHRKLATAIADRIRQWEQDAPLLTH